MTARLDRPRTFKSGWRLSPGALLSWMPVGLAGLMVSSASGQETPRESTTGEKSAQAAKNKETLNSYNLHVGPLTFQVEPSLAVEFNDNIYWTEYDRVSDAIIRPELKLRAYYPISQLNTLSASVGIGYEYYVKNHELNSSQPLISPGTELVSHLYAGDFHFRLNESFSYEESLSRSGYSYNTGQFYNLSGTAKFGRYDNKAGVLADWDLDRVVLTLGYQHENFWSSTSEYDYLNRQSELFQASATYFAAQQVRTGIESDAGFNRYEHPADETYHMEDHWRFKVGPFLGVDFTPNLKFQGGGGYEGVRATEYDFNGLNDNTYYAYAKLGHRINQRVNQALLAGQENTLGWSSESQQDTYVRYSITFSNIRKMSISPRFSVDFIDSQGTVKEVYTLYQAGVDALYHLSARWRVFANYNYLVKDSDSPFRSYTQNSLNIGIVYRH
jgi:hypothetical protein